jgi:hypothetical protein
METVIIPINGAKITYPKKRKRRKEIMKNIFPNFLISSNN